MRPIILVTPRLVDDKTYALSHNYTNAIKEEGGLPILCSYGNTEEIDDLLDLVDGIVFSGGGDIDASFFGEETDERASCIYDFRDEYEIQLCKKAIERDMPILGICRGVQILNVSLGGTLKQHIDGHYVKDADGTDLLHNIIIEENSRFEKMFAEKNIGVNSIHHQCIDKLGEGLTVQCYSTCGLIEGVVMESKKFVVGVQFHPEIIVNDHDEYKVLFKEFLDACKK